MRISDWSSDVCSSDLPELRVARRKKAVNGFGLDEQAPTFVALPLAVDHFDRIVGKDRLRGEVPMGNGIADRTRPAGEEIANAKSAFPMCEAGHAILIEIGRASCRERVLQAVWISVGAVLLKKK